MWLLSHTFIRLYYCMFLKPQKVEDVFFTLKRIYKVVQNARLKKDTLMFPRGMARG